MSGFRMKLHGVLLAGLIAGPASGHVVFAEPRAKAGGYYAGFLRVSHGCGGSDTVSVRVEIPDGVTSARPQPKPGWTISIDRLPLAKPIKGEGGATIKDRVIAITWTGRLPVDYFDQFGIMMKLPTTAGPIYFPTVQTCASGGNRWLNIPVAGQAWHNVKDPAPVLEVTTPDDMHMHH